MLVMGDYIVYVTYTCTRNLRYIAIYMYMYMYVTLVLHVQMYVYMHMYVLHVIYTCTMYTCMCIHVLCRTQGWLFSSVITPLQWYFSTFKLARGTQCVCIQYRFTAVVCFAKPPGEFMSVVCVTCQCVYSIDT